VTVKDGWLIVGGKEPSTATLRTLLPDRYRLSCEASYTGKDGHPLQLTGTNAKGSTYEDRHAVKNQPEELHTDRSGNGLFSVRLKLVVPPGEKLSIRTLKFKPLDARPLFNGTDLTGWHVFPGRKSKFTVEDGVLRVQDGPGDLQTEGKYGDFVLQLECKSNGKHLNSGIFFRCRPDEYQNGYEAQIRNQFTELPTQEYTIEKYDPQTHQLVGKEKVKATAVDYGTGAIYRRVPARKEASKDGEWFTLTVVAHGNHFATWVNGIQQADWTDHRPRSDNARTGCRLEAGHLSIQGHDPTTDLSFRNFRIAELPSMK